MAEHPNAALVRDMFRAFHDGDVATLQSVLAENAVWHFPGRHGKLAGVHRGREAIFSFLLSVQALTNHTFTLDLIDVVANDQRAVALFRGKAKRNGKSLDNPTCLLIRLDGGQVREVWEYVWDLFEVDEFWR
jgi:uncharacterized protein